MPTAAAGAGEQQGQGEDRQCGGMTEQEQCSSAKQYEQCSGEKQFEQCSGEKKFEQCSGAKQQERSSDEKQQVRRNGEKQQEQTSGEQPQEQGSGEKRQEQSSCEKRQQQSSCEKEHEQPCRSGKERRECGKSARPGGYTEIRHVPSPSPPPCGIQEAPRGVVSCPCRDEAPAVPSRCPVRPERRRALTLDSLPPPPPLRTRQRSEEEAPRSPLRTPATHGRCVAVPPGVAAAAAELCEYRVSQCGWYYPGMSHAEAARTLEQRGAPVGSYLLRDSAHPAHRYALSVHTSKGVSSVRVTRAPRGGYCLDTTAAPAAPRSGQPFTFPDVIALVRYYVTVSAAQRHPESRSSAAPGQWVLADGSGNMVTIGLAAPLTTRLAPPTLQHLARRAINSHHPAKTHTDSKLPKLISNYLHLYPYDF